MGSGAPANPGATGFLYHIYINIGVILHIVRHFEPITFQTGHLYWRCPTYLHMEGVGAFVLGLNRYITLPFGHQQSYATGEISGIARITRRIGMTTDVIVHCGNSGICLHTPDINTVVFSLKAITILLVQSEEDALIGIIRQIGCRQLRRVKRHLLTRW